MPSEGRAMTFPDTAAAWRARAASLTLPSRLVIGGQPDDAGGRSMPVISPRDGREFATVPDGDAADVDRAVAAARYAVTDSPWSRLTPTARTRLLHRFADAVEAHREELALLVSL